MKKQVRTMMIITLLAALALALVACGGGSGGSKTGYQVDDVKAKLVEVFKISESDIKVNDRGATVVLSYGSEDVTLDAYVFEKAKDAPDTFTIAAMAGSFEDKRIDTANHKVWVEEYESWFDGSITYSIIAMKDNFILSAMSEVKPETVIEAFQLG